MTSRVLVTGGTGFIGAALVRRLRDEGHPVRATRFRRPPLEGAASVEWCSVGSIGPQTSWVDALRGVHVVVHAAGRAHVMHRTSDAAASAEEINTNGTVRLAQSAARAGVERLIFLSSIGVHGTHTDGVPFTEESPFRPEEPYARSKQRAERELREVAAQTGMSVVVLRPPLVYGPAAPGNFARLVALVRSGLPLPLGGIENARSLIALDNLVDVVVRCVRDAAAVGESFVVCDGEDFSTPALLRLIAQGLDVRLRMFAVPPAWLRRAGSLLRRRDEVEKVCQSLQVDDSKVRKLLHWQPGIDARAAIVAAAAGSAGGAARAPRRQDGA